MAGDYELEVLLSLDGFEFRFAGGYRVKIEAQRVEATTGRPNEPKIWCEPIGRGQRRNRPVSFASLEAGAKLLSAKNRLLLRAIAERQPNSITELAAMTGRAEQNVLRTLTKLAAAGIVRLD